MTFIPWPTSYIGQWRSYTKSVQEAATATSGLIPSAAEPIPAERLQLTSDAPPAAITAAPSNQTQTDQTVANGKLRTFEGAASARTGNPARTTEMLCVGCLMAVLATIRLIIAHETLFKSLWVGRTPNLNRPLRHIAFSWRGSRTKTRVKHLKLSTSVAVVRLQGFLGIALVVFWSDCRVLHCNGFAGSIPI